MQVREEYKVCDRCREKINEHWYKIGSITKFKNKLFVNGMAINSEFDLCGKCIEHFERFMCMDTNIGKPTEYEQYYADREEKI